MDTDRYRVQPGTTVDLQSWSTTAHRRGGASKKKAADLLEGCNERLADLQQLLAASAEHKLLVVLQGMDTAGKDGTIKNVFRASNPLGVTVASFKRPTPTEASHDFLWRVHQHTPAKGQVAVFNRSHYEDVVAVRVHGLVEERVWRRRYDHLRHFEDLLADDGTVIRKFFLHISRHEQRIRLQRRLDDPARHWKIHHGDLDERKHWDEYQHAYQEAISATSSERAPWYIVPADNKWYRNIVIARVLVDALGALDMAYPEPDASLAARPLD